MHAALDRIPPHNLDAERAVLGALLVVEGGVAAQDHIRDLEPDEFYSDANRAIFRTIRNMIGAGEPVELRTLADELRREDQLEFVGGPAYLALLEVDAAILGHLPAYVRTVKEHAIERLRIQISSGITTSSYEGNTEKTRSLLAQLEDLGRRATTGWPDPIPLSRHIAPPFPLDVLPDSVREHVKEVAASTQTPPELAGILSLSVIATTIQARVVVEGQSGWPEPPPLYTLAVLASGEGKSPAYKHMTAPITDYERVLGEETRVERARAAEARRGLEARVEHLRKAAAKEADAVERRPLEEQAQDAAAELDATPRPVRPRFIANNATVEKYEDLAITHRRLAVLDDEGTVFQVIAGRYSHGRPNMEFFLHGLDAPPINVDRMGREAHSDSRWGPPLTMGLTVQPVVLRDLARIPGTVDRGLPARFLMVMPASMVGHRAADVPELSEATAGRYAALVTAMLREPVPDEPAVLRLAPLARKQLMAFRARVEPRLRLDGGDLGHMADFGGKITGKVARIAAGFHMAAHALEAGRGLDRLISAETMARAIRLAETFLIPHAKIAYSEMGADPAVAKAERILALIRQKGSLWLTRREAYTECRPAIGSAKDADAPLELLVDHHYLRPVEPSSPQDVSKRGRKPTPRYQVNPKALGCPPGEFCEYREKLR